jgi:hypothetical protein
MPAQIKMLNILSFLIKQPEKVFFIIKNPKHTNFFLIKTFISTVQNAVREGSLSISLQLCDRLHSG